MEKKSAVIMEGGAMRGMYTVGVLDVMMDNNIEIWISPGNRPENELKYIYIDSITLIREE